MAFYDNRHWLLSHLRNSFISSDDTGMCESVIIDGLPKESELFGEYDKYPNIDESSEEDDNFDNSLDLHTNTDFDRPRLRTNTAQRLAKMEDRMKEAAKVKHVKWESPSKVSEEAKRPGFEKKEMKPRTGPMKSLLSSQIENCPMLPKNPFLEYAQFGGNAQPRAATRTYKVFLTMLGLPERNYPLTVCVLRSAKVDELVGYVCWKYTTENSNSDVRLKDDVTRYGLFIAEDDGEVDWDFSFLEPKEYVDKFGLKYLALVEMPEKDKTEGRKTEDGGADSAGPADGAAEPAPEEASWKQIKGDLTAIEALLYQSFSVQIMSKMRTRTEAILGINSDKMEIDPVVTSAKVPGKMWRLKSASYDMDDIVFCDLVDTKSSGRAAFRVVRRAAVIEEPATASSPTTNISTYKNHDFEADQKVAEEIVRKVNLILHLKCSIYRREYLTQRDRKPRRRKSFSIWPR